MGSWDGTVVRPAPPVSSGLELLTGRLPHDESLSRRAQGPMGVLAGLEGRLDDDQPVGQDRAALDVKEVVAQLPGGAQLRAGVPAAKLRPPGDPRLHQMAPDVMRKTALQLGADLRALRPRPDERHVSA